MLQKVQLFDEFVEGAVDGFRTVYQVLPTLIGLLVAVGLLRNSGALGALGEFLSPVAAWLHFPGELVPLVVVKMFSSSAATGVLLDLYKTAGVDSYLSTLASVLMSCSETIFYTLSVYYVSAKVTKTRWTLPGALLATLAGVVASCLIV